MVDVAIPFPTGSYPGKNRQESGGRIVNGVVEALAPDAESRKVIRRAPGLATFGVSGYDGYRGALLAGSALYAAFSGELVKFDSAGVKTDLSDLTGTDPVSFARNNKLPSFDAVCVADSTAYTIDATTGAATLVDADLPSPTDVCSGDGYFFFPIADGRVFSSGVNATTVSALDFTRCNTRPDANMRGIWYGGRLLIWGADSCEIYYNAANPVGFPFSREAVVKGPGLGSKWGICGYEDGWEKGLFWHGSDNAIHTLQGYQAIRVSTPDIDRALEAVADRSTIRARCYVEGGHAFVEFSWGTGCWTLDLTTNSWAEGKSQYDTFRRAVGPAVKAFDRWLCGDRLSGDLVESTDAAYDELGEPLVVEVTSGKCRVGYGQRMSARFSFVKGVGSIAGADPIERDPQIEISWSDDGGKNFGNPIARKLGRIGQNRPVIELSANVLGACRGDQGRVFKIRMSDPREFALLGGVLTVV